jgi:hypothetical protein
MIGATICRQQTHDTRQIKTKVAIIPRSITYSSLTSSASSASIGIMSAPDPVADGTLKLLDHLPPKPRALYVEKLSKDEVVAIVLVVWKERDAAKTQSANQGMPSVYVRRRVY